MSTQQKIVDAAKGKKQEAQILMQKEREKLDESGQEDIELELIPIAFTFIYKENGVPIDDEQMQAVFHKKMSPQKPEPDAIHDSADKGTITE